MASDPDPDRLTRRQVPRPPEGWAWCCRCQRSKTVAEFGLQAGRGLRSWCRPCSTAYTRERRSRGIAVTPEARERARERQQTEASRARRRARRNTPRGKLMEALGEARRAARKASNHAERAALDAQIALLERDLTRLDQGRTRKPLSPGPAPQPQPQDHGGFARCSS